MLLAIDVGNTNMVFGLIEGDALTGSFRLMTDANRTSDEIGLAAWDYFQRFGEALDKTREHLSSRHYFYSPCSKK